MLCPTCFLQGGPLPKESGEVKWFNPHKQYGFIKTDAGEEVFFHRKQLLVTDGSGPQAGQRVQFHLRFPVRGPEAVNVELGEG
jgi:cold shock CspA family protein